MFPAPLPAGLVSQRRIGAVRAMRFWTTEHDAELVRLKEVGWSAARIGGALGCTRGMVIGRWHRLQHTEFPSHQKRKDEEAARKADRRAKRDDRRQRVGRDLERLLSGGTSRGVAIVEARRDGATLQDIADFFGVTRERIRQIEEREKSAA
jgi:hypothetical protein